MHRPHHMALDTPRKTLQPSHLKKRATVCLRLAKMQQESDSVEAHGQGGKAGVKLSIQQLAPETKDTQERFQRCLRREEDEGPIPFS